MAIESRCTGGRHSKNVSSLQDIVVNYEMNKVKVTDFHKDKYRSTRLSPQDEDENSFRKMTSARDRLRIHNQTQMNEKDIANN